MARDIVDTLVGDDAFIILSGDDTLCRKRGLGIFGAVMHHDPLSSSKSKKICHWGHDWVDLCIVIANPWWAPSKASKNAAAKKKESKRSAEKNRKGSHTSHQTRPELMTEMLAMFLYSLTILWYATEGQADFKIPHRLA